jgi:hypothetical protein
MTTAAIPRWRTVLVAVALLGGLLAMHALTHHGEHVPSVSAATATGADHGHGHDRPAAPVDDHHDDGVMTLCLAMLAGAAMLLLAAAVRRRPTRPVVLLRRRPPGGVPLRVRSRAHAPPTPWTLSVCRC